MSNEVDMYRAKVVFDALIRALDAQEWKYEKDADKLRVKLGFNGDDFSISILVAVKPESQVVQVFSNLPFNMAEDKRVDGAIAVCVANYGLIDGSFDYDISDGQIMYRLTSSYRGSYLSEDLFEYMISCTIGTVERYNDKFFLISKGMLAIDEFIAQENA